MLRNDCKLVDEKGVKVSVDADTANRMPFILRYVEERIGAVGPTTSGTYDDADGADYT